VRLTIATYHSSTENTTFPTHSYLHKESHTQSYTGGSDQGTVQAGYSLVKRRNADPDRLWNSLQASRRVAIRSVASAYHSRAMLAPMRLAGWPPGGSLRMPFFMKV